MSEKELLESAVKKDEKAFEELIGLTVAKVRNSIFSAYNPLNPEDFADALQNATIKAWNKIENFRGESAFSTWFYIILKNEVLNILKSKNIVRKHEIPMDDLTRMKDTDGKYDAESMLPRDMIEYTVAETAQTILEKQDELQEYRNMLQGILVRLKPSHSQIIKMVFEEGKSYKEVSDELKIPIGTVMSRLFFARQNAQKLIKQYANRNNIQLSCLG
jgi:RNA polymerase sigma-70 factor, ECF subfamily